MSFSSFSVLFPMCAPTTQPKTNKRFILSDLLVRRGFDKTPTEVIKSKLEQFDVDFRLETLICKLFLYENEVESP